MSEEIEHIRTRELFYLANMIHICTCPIINHKSLKEKIKDSGLWLRIKYGQLRTYISSWWFSRQTNYRKYISQEYKRSLRKRLKIRYLFWRL